MDILNQTILAPSSVANMKVAKLNKTAMCRILFETRGTFLATFAAVFSANAGFEVAFETAKFAVAQAETANQEQLPEGNRCGETAFEYHSRSGKRYIVITNDNFYENYIFYDPDSSLTSEIESEANKIVVEQPICKHRCRCPRCRKLKKL